MLAHHVLELFQSTRKVREKAVKPRIGVGHFILSAARLHVKKDTRQPLMNFSFHLVQGPAKHWRNEGSNYHANYIRNNLPSDYGAGPRMVVNSHATDVVSVRSNVRVSTLPK